MRRSPIEDRPDPADPLLVASDQQLDEALAMTFPASDPPAQTQPIVHIGAKTTNGGPSSGALR